MPESPSDFKKIPFTNAKVSRGNFWALIALLVVSLASLLLVGIFKKPGQHGVIESQTMDMNNMRPPTGAVPVAVQQVAQRTIGQTITYSGTVRAYTDEDVVARISGRISRMHVYPGDRVKRGQLLVELDGSGSEYQQRAEESKLAAEASVHSVRIAEQELQQRQEEVAASAATIKQAEKELEAAKADLNYWQREIARQATLLKSQVISQEEYDRDLAKFQTAKAKVDQGIAKVQETRTKSRAAKEAVEAAQHHIMHQETMAKQAQAAARVASTLESYTRIRASDSGVVTERVVSPGVTVTPGQVLLRIAHIDSVRVQASVSSSDVSQVKIGDPVAIKVASGEEVIANSTISAVFPAADPTARTSVVESIVSNGASKFVPGQYVVMEITTGTRSALTIPTSAIVWLEGKPHVWRTSDSRPRIAQLITIPIGLTNAEYTEVTSGLKAGDSVIYMGQTDLQPGMPVVPTEWTATGPKALPSVAESGALRLDSSNKWRLEKQLDQLVVEVTMANVPPKGGNNALVITVKDSAGKPKAGVSVQAKLSMPAMNMGGPDLSGRSGGDGKTSLSAHFMSGPWHASISIDDGKKQSFGVDIEVL